MRILIASATYWPHKNGCSYFTQRLAQNLQKRRHEILVIAPSTSLHQGYFTHDGVKIYGTRSISLFFYKDNDFRLPLPVIAKGNLRKVIKEFNPDVTHIQGHYLTSSTVLGISKEFGIPVVGTNHFMPDNLTPFLHLPESIDEIINRIAWLYFCHIFNKVDYVTTPTKAAGEILKKNGFKKEVHPVSNGIDLNIFNPKNNGNYLKTKYSLSGKKIILTVARLEKEKNIDWIIKALPSVVKKDKNVQLVIVGDGILKDNLKNLASSLGMQNNVTFTGLISNDDLKNIYAIADCFVMAGTVELQSLVTMEAMATGIPVIAADALALPELVENGKNGYLFEPGDIKGLVGLVLKILENPTLQKQMGKSSLQLIQKHDINKTISEFENIYKSLQIKNP